MGSIGRLDRGRIPLLKPAWGRSEMPASEGKHQKELYEFGPFRIDTEKEVLLRAGEPVQLTPKTFQLLLVLVRRHQELVTKDDLMKAVWPDTFVEEANLSRNIFMLRKALGETPQDHQYVLTVPGRGYRFAETVRLVPEQQVDIVAAQHSKVQRKERSIFWDRSEWIATCGAGGCDWPSAVERAERSEPSLPRRGSWRCCCITCG